MMEITREEAGSLLVFALFIGFWSFVFVPQFQAWIQRVDEPSPILFYPLFNAVYILLFTFLTYILLRVLGRHGALTHLMTSAFRYGLAGFILLWMIPDLIAPPYLVTTDGNLLRSHPLWATVGDSFWYVLIQPYVPASMIYVTLYFVVPILMFTMVLLLASPHQLAKLVKKL